MNQPDALDAPTTPSALHSPAPTRRAVVAGMTVTAAVCGGSAQAQDPLTPEAFGAKGDGRTNDTAAFGRLSAAVTRRGGGTIVLRRTTYLVGEQRAAIGSGEGFSFVPSPILRFLDLPGALTIRGNGATLRCAPGLRFGSFDPLTGEPHRHAMPFIDPRTKATPYTYMIHVERCGGDLLVEDIELDGNLRAMRLGSPYGDTGIQIEGSGLFLRDNRGSEVLRGIHTHHHPQDGMMIDGLDDAALARRVTRRAENVRCEDNGRQGCSLIGGRGWHFSRCAFDRTGRAGLQSAPAAGFDIEAEGAKTNRDHAFEDCRFVDNAGCGLVADSGDSEGASFVRCRFVGTTNWSVWTAKPRFRFAACTIVGCAVQPWGDADPTRATRFVDCLFTDDPKLSPTGRVYREGRKDGPLYDLSDKQNVLFDRCRFLAVGGAVLPWSKRAIYRNCILRQTSASQGYPQGTYQGTITLVGNVDLYGSKFENVTLNGAPYKR